MGRRIIALIIAAVVALAGAGLLFVYARTADQRAVEAQNPVPVYVSNGIVPAGTTLKDAVANNLIVQTSVAAKGRPAGALEAVEAANESQVALTDINPGEYILSSRFGEARLATSLLAIPAGHVAVSMRITKPDAVNAFISPGSQIVVFSTYKLKLSQPQATAAGGDDAQETRVLFDNVMVIGVDASTNAPKPTTGTGPQDAAAAAGGDSIVITVALMPNDAERLIHAIRVTTLAVGLRGVDAKPDLTYTVTSGYLGQPTNLFDKK